LGIFYFGELHHRLPVASSTNAQTSRQQYTQHHWPLGQPSPSWSRAASAARGFRTEGMIATLTIAPTVRLWRAARAVSCTSRCVSHNVHQCVAHRIGITCHTVLHPAPNIHADHSIPSKSICYRIIHTSHPGLLRNGIDDAGAARSVCLLWSTLRIADIDLQHFEYKINRITKKSRKSRF
jgi:hypothetical protein